MKRKKKILLKRPAKILIAVLVLVLAIVLTPIFYRNYYRGKLTDHGYSAKAIDAILPLHKQKDVLEIEYNETLDAAFASGDYEEKNWKKYPKIALNQKLKNFTDYANQLLKKGYNVEETSAILRSGTDTSIPEFLKREKEEDTLDMLQYEWAKLENYDRYLAYQLESREDEENTVTYVNIGLDRPFYENPIIVTEYHPTMLVDHYRKLNEDFVPDQLTSIDSKYLKDKTAKELITKMTLNAYLKMYEAAKKEGLEILVNSAYRSYEDQQAVCDTYQEAYGSAYVEKYVAKPGFSEHQTGLCFDLASATSNIFAESAEYQWMLNHAHEYGFILRFPKGREDVTGYRAEPWHYRYVGKEVATKMVEEDLTLDEYYIRYLDRD